MADMKNNVALVTSAGSGIGRATAYAFARAGAHVAIADWNEAEGESTAAKIREKGGNAIFIHADVSKANDVKNMVDVTVKTFGQLDFACNNCRGRGCHGATE